MPQNQYALIQFGGNSTGNLAVTTTIENGECMSMSKLHRNSAGDTIVEVLIAVAVVSLVLGAAFAVVNRTLHNAQQAREHTEALNLLQGQLERVKSTIKKYLATQYLLVVQSFVLALRMYLRQSLARFCPLLHTQPLVLLMRLTGDIIWGVIRGAKQYLHCQGKLGQDQLGAQRK
jgi:hypothetical protein